MMFARYNTIAETQHRLALPNPLDSERIYQILTINNNNIFTNNIAGKILTRVMNVN